MSSYHATREAARARFFKEMGEATSDAGCSRVIWSMGEAAHQAECTRTMQQVLYSLLDIYQTYQTAALQATEIKECLRTLRADLITNATEIEALKEVQSITTKHSAAQKAHDIAFKTGLRSPAHTDPFGPGRIVARDGKAYMAMTTKWNSDMFIAMKSKAQAPEIALLMGKALEAQIQVVRDSNPGLARRMRKWDNDSKNDGNDKTQNEMD
ncbi:hypothetical protein G6011_01782 [Alternaria panax]|uniref:Uncharacterized protein n=1 Tax=Alternaria panax TaxID=48097 RepID=A0AAD4IKI6_9PLEO|nr:hypothetical protein G6011_01782 [Alternaria panax]